MEEYVKRAAPVPVQRIIEKLDEYQARRDFEGAERHLKYWLEEARFSGDERGELAVRNEFIGLYRKNGRKEEAFSSVEEAVALVGRLGFEGTTSAGTTYTNAATAYYTFGEYTTSLFWFEKALNVYESNKNTSPVLLGGLYNNMGLACTALKLYDRAYTLYKKALAVMEQVPEGKPERAITYLNIADALEAQKGLETAEGEICGLLDRAEELLDEVWADMESKSEAEKGYFAFVCSSCAPTFSHFGYFMTAAELKRKAEEFYSGNSTGTDPD